MGASRGNDMPSVNLPEGTNVKSNPPAGPAPQRPHLEGAGRMPDMEKLKKKK
jgi:hypothetical protein